MEFEEVMNKDDNFCKICFQPEENTIKGKLISCRRAPMHLFCLDCILFWKVSHESCPLKCTEHPWEIDLPKEALQVAVQEGFLVCSNCARIGCEICLNKECRRKMLFRPIINTGRVCTFCPPNSEETISESDPQPILILHYSFGHDESLEPNNPITCTSNYELYFLKCQKCSRKFCCPGPRVITEEIL